jgi:SAM-dependent methyltransferase
VRKGVGANVRTREYLLGDSRRESARLRHQAQLWDPVTRKLLDRLRIRRGSAVLEIGPGLGTIHVELRRRAHRAVDFVEPSHAFASQILRRSRRDGLGSGRYFPTDLMHAALPQNTYDLIFGRWVFLFLEDPQAHVRILARALKPGGRLVVVDYAHRDSWAIVPRPAEWNDFLAADRAFFARRGGDASIGGRLPRFCERAGLRLDEMRPTIMTGGPSSKVWEWLWSYFLSVKKRYAAIDPLSPAKAARLERQWRAAASTPNAFVIAPSVVDIVARRPARARG